jgi:hypothetical protein
MNIRRDWFLIIYSDPEGYQHVHAVPYPDQMYRYAKELAARGNNILYCAEPIPGWRDIVYPEKFEDEDGD